MNINEFIKEYGVCFDFDMVSSNPNMADTDWRAYHYLCTIEIGGTMEVYFSQGMGITEDPTAETVLECLQTDFMSLEYGDSFEDWAASLGYDTDSRKAEKIFRTVEAQRDEFRTIAGAEAFREFLQIEF